MYLLLGTRKEHPRSIMTKGELMRSPYFWFVLTGLLAMRWVYLLLRVSAYRIDRPQGGSFGVPYFWSSQGWDKRNYTEEGQPLLRQTRLTVTAAWVCAVIGLLLLP
jgi:hypothetical protein